MAKENAMPPMIVHVLGLALTAGLVWACYWVWQEIPRFTGPTLLNPLRIVCALLGMFAVLTIAHLLTKLLRRLAVRSS